jgi:hypothetical protein
MVQLQYASSWLARAHDPQSRQTEIVIRVRKSSGRQTRVFVQCHDQAGMAMEKDALFLREADDRTDLYNVRVEGNLSREGFVIAYRLDNVTYWDDQNGARYHVADGPLLGQGFNVRVENTYVGEFSSENVLRGLIDVRRSGARSGAITGPRARVIVHYTADNWVTTKQVEARSLGSWRTRGQSTIDNPNQHGVEGFYFEANPERSTNIQLYVVYEVDGQRYRDDNFGRYYSPSR